MKKPQKPVDLNVDELVDEAESRISAESFVDLCTLPLQHFKLTSHPFADSVNPEYFFRTESHEEAFISMKQCIEDGISLGLTTAISGTGKTLLTQVLLQELDPRRYQAILLLAYPGMSRSGLLREIIGELGIDGNYERAKIHELIARIQHHVVEQYVKGVRLVIIIDEVHFLQTDALHILRTISNIEQPEQKLVTILLFGEQSFLEKMKHPSMRAIFSRMFGRTVIRPLHYEEMKQYIKFRLLVAGGKPGLIASSCMELLFRNSCGIPREINRICHNALAIAAREGRDCVDADQIARVVPALSVERG